jgi:hypothetical protein
MTSRVMTSRVMNRRVMGNSLARFLSVLPLVVAPIACSSSPAQPSVTAPGPQQPANNAQISNASQPITLVVANSTTTGSAPLTYTFEVATDAAFASKVFTNSSVPQGANGVTSVQLGTLPGGLDYYWHVRAGATGTFSTTFKFTIGPPIVINAPTPVAPLNGSTSTGWPTLIVNDAVRSGPAGPLVYRFDIATSASFNPITLTGTTSETPNQTSFTPSPSQPAPAQTALFWRALAIDPVNVIASPPSAVQSFTYSGPPSVAAIKAAQEGAILWPGAQPPGTNGQAALGGFWNVDTLISYTGVAFLSPPLETLQIFDLLDRGFDPQGAINWMHGNGYATVAAYYPAVNVIGFTYEYMALNNGRWDLILKAGA